MTTPSPYTPGSHPAPLPSTQPVLKPSPLALGDAFSGVFELYKRDWKLFILIALIPTLLMIAVVVAYVVAIVGFVVQLGAFGSAAGAVLEVLGQMMLVFVAFLVAMVVVAAVQYKCYGMIALGATDVVQGRATPTVGSLWARTRGVGLRALGVTLTFMVAIMAAYALVAGVLFAVLARTTSDRGDGGAAAGVTVLLVFLLAIAAIVVSVFLSVRWYYWVPVMAVEGRGGFASLGRSWQLTAGQFWRTLGWSLLAGLLVGLPGGVLSGVGQVAIPNDATTINNNPGALLVPLLIATMLPVAVSIVTAPFMELFRTVMYLDQVNRSTGNVVQQPVWGGGYAYGQPPYYPQQPPAPQQFPPQPPVN